jgi:hypothetical protein
MTDRALKVCSYTFEKRNEKIEEKRGAKYVRGGSARRKRKVWRHHKFPVGPSRCL